MGKRDREVFCHHGVGGKKKTQAKEVLHGKRKTSLSFTKGKK